ncbi:DUF4105 domain-containing protein [Sulfurimonas aquatica]|uniref:DUF4105 domain-containing protein n=1 Tax=Sulfurimonas aquatica TaxID=2672570 RepID=A0A975AZF0_9BACT|nr:DUF4105 domain-containing protein [Sulfurimonas aquatica]QSZ41384.1 DUF4105 domain-containing protein [Sulfurimonas aquatica]
MRDSFYKLFILLSLILLTPLYSFESLELQKLAQESYWSKLLHFNEVSSINSRDFFLSTDKEITPYGELTSTLEAFRADPALICKYPARYKWLNSKLKLNIKHSKCEKLDMFLAHKFEKISMVFTSERYNSSASVFGHTFLKLSGRENSFVIDYTAKVPDNVNGLSYAYNGIFGGYKSSYKFSSFMLKEYEYTNEEFRDLITFDLNFSKDEIENIMLHLYEVLETRQDYYFLSRNCSSELIKLLDLGREELSLSKELALVTLPIEVVYILEKNNYINKISITPSKIRLFNSLTSTLSKKETELLKKIVTKEIGVHYLRDTKEISDVQKKKIVSAGISYIEIDSLSDDFDKSLVYPLMKLIKLQEVYGYELALNDEVLSEIPISNKYHQLRLGGVAGDIQDSYVNLDYRYLYRHRFDLLDSVEKHGSVEFLDLSLRVKNKELELNYLTFFNLESLPISTDYFFTPTKTVQIGLKRVFYDENIYSYFNYSLGYRRELAKNLTYHLSAKVGLYYYDKPSAMAQAGAYLEYNNIEDFNLQLAYESSCFYNAVDEYKYMKTERFLIKTNIAILDNYRINLFISHERDIEIYNRFGIKYSLNF